MTPAVREFLKNRFLWTAMLAAAFIIASLLIGNAIAEQGPHPAWYADVSAMLRDVALALVIAIAIGMSIEAAAHLEMDEKLKRALEAQHAELKEVRGELAAAVAAGNATLYQRLPESVQDEINTSILRSDFVRFDIHVVYELSVVNARTLDSAASDKRVMKVLLRSTYRIKNIAFKARNLPISIGIDNPADPALQNLTRIQRVVVDGKEVDVNARTTRKTETHAEFEYTVEDVAPGRYVSVLNEVTMIKSLDDYEVWQSTHAGNGFTADIVFPDDVTDWGAFEIHRTDLNVQGKATKTPHLTINEALLPNQGFSFWWRC